MHWIGSATENQWNLESEKYEPIQKIITNNKRIKLYCIVFMNCTMDLNFIFIFNWQDIIFYKSKYVLSFVDIKYEHIFNKDLSFDLLHSYVELKLFTT